VLLAVQNAAAEYYRVVEKDGTIRYTDNFGDVPPEQRQGIKAYDEPEDYLNDAEIEKKRQQEQAARIKALEESEVTKKQEVIDNLDIVDSPTASFDDIRAALDRELEALKQEKKALDEEFKTVKTPEQATVYNKKLDLFHQRVQNFSARRTQFNEKLNAHNEAKQAAPEQTKSQ
jgi:hypothetical protein